MNGNIVFLGGAFVPVPDSRVMVSGPTTKMPNGPMVTGMPDMVTPALPAVKVVLLITRPEGRAVSI